MEMTLDPNVGMTIAMDIPRMLRKDMTALSEMSAKYRGVKLTLMAGGNTTDAAIEQLNALDVAIGEARAQLSEVAAQTTNAARVPGAVGGHSTNDLESDIAALNEEKVDAEGNVPHPGQDAHNAAEAARNRYKRPGRRPVKPSK